MNKEEPNGSSRQSGLVTASHYSALGFEFAGTNVAGVIVGNYLDEYLHTTPLFTLLLTLSGMGGALYRLLWSLKRFSSQSNHDA